MTHETATPDTEQIYEQHIPQGERVVLADALEAVKQHGLVRYVVEEHAEADGVVQDILRDPLTVEEIEATRGLIRAQQSTLDVGHGQSTVDMEHTEQLARQLIDIPDAYIAAHAVLNTYRPGEDFYKHCDLDEESTDKYSPEHALSFLYIAEGTKTIAFYLGEGDEPTVVPQRAGELYVFQGGGCIYPDGTTRRGLYHEVPPQDTDSVTINFELIDH